jgi:hypothetical protein
MSVDARLLHIADHFVRLVALEKHKPTINGTLSEVASSWS